MRNDNKVGEKNSPTTKNKFWQFIRKNGFSTLMGIFIVVLLVSPDAKSFMLQQLMRTGVFNASIDKKGSATSTHSDNDFDFVDHKGNVQSTASLRGKVVFINFWASWCPPCRAEFPSIERLYSRFKDNPNMFFLTINEDTDLSAGYDYLKKENYSVPFYRTNSKVPSDIYSGALPTTIVLDKAGKVRFHHAGFANYGSDKFVKQIEELIKE
ncbi:TlpA family protein disulfide reductase [Olivibacter sp. SDN3]|uniref:TlpA family protein disulfide reductase n=1 Tax=Olivibacter sp. SDN3 TaxID=2764720 RepID=UPI0016513587|nr:TlpA disulfide reductase family protein [Olivibacter sp. SDN3]QNL52185.1 TlpA family protein disulfide reductase [Olivibacter sp. SDN3]